MFFWGVWAVIDCVTHLRPAEDDAAVLDVLARFRRRRPARWISTRLRSDHEVRAVEEPAAEARGTEIRAKLAPYQGTCGLFAIAMGALYIVWPYVA